jgi:hypothetical protein
MEPVMQGTRMPLGDDALNTIGCADCCHEVKQPSSSEILIGVSPWWNKLKRSACGCRCRIRSISLWAARSMSCVSSRMARVPFNSVGEVAAADAASLSMTDGTVEKPVAFPAATSICRQRCAGQVHRHVIVDAGIALRSPHVYILDPGSWAGYATHVDHTLPL